MSQICRVSLLLSILQLVMGNFAFGQHGLKSFCPKGNGFFVLYYGSDDADIDLIIKAKPNFVVLAHELNQKSVAERFRSAKIRSLIYVSMTYDRKTAATKLNIKLEELKNYSCALIKQDKEIDIETSSLRKNGFDGVFYDCARFALDDAAATKFNQPLIKKLTSEKRTIHDWNKERVQGAKAGEGDFLVIMNPGTAPVDLRMFEYADIVSVENRWDRVVAVVPNTPVKPWRWLAVQGDPAQEAAKNGEEGIKRLRQFRVNKGFWYYSAPNGSGEATHNKLFEDEDFMKFATQAKSENAPCSQ